MPRRNAVVIAAVALAACKSEPARPQRIGRLLIEGSARRILISPDGKTAALLLDAREAKAEGAPEGVFAGTLAVARLDGEPAARRLDAGVTDLDGGFLFSPDGRRLAWLAGYRFREGRGDLRVLDHDAGGEPRLLAKGVGFYGFTRLARILWIDGADQLGADPPLQPGRLPAPPLRSFEVRPDGESILTKEKSGRLRIMVAGAELARYAGHYAFSPHSEHFAWEQRNLAGTSEGLYLWDSVPGTRPRKIAGGATDFVFSPDGTRIAYVTPPGEGSLFGDLYVAGVDGTGTPARLGERVVGFRFAPTGALALLAKYDYRARTGNLVVSVPGAASVDLGPGVASFDFSPSGAYLAYLQRVVKPIFTQELWVARVAAEPKARRVEQGVYGLQFAAGERLLGFKARCRDNGASCALFTVDPAGGVAVERVKDVAGFDFSPDGTRVLAMRPFRGATSAVEVWVHPASGGEGLFVAGAATPSVRWVDAGRIIYSTLQFAGAPGVYLAELP